jgi:hypothetical protein
MIYAQANAARLAFLRIALLTVCAIDVALDPFPALATLPRAWFSGHGPWALVPEAVIDALWSEPVLLGLKLTTLIVLGLAALGARTPRLWAGLAALLLTLIWSFVRGFGHADHSQLQLLFSTFALPFLPAWDALSLTREEPREQRAYVGAFVTLAVVFGFPYFLTGAARLAQEGFGIFVGDAMQHFMARETMSLDDFDFTLGLSLLDPALRPALNLGFFGVTLAELGTPWAYLKKSFCLVWLALIVPFHVLAPVLMHVLFVHNLALIALLYLWPLSWAYAPFYSRAEGRASTGRAK